ncbi:MAG: right-handed parallel beta-helix repeat-containing protein [Candidatus Aminicenantales bacterium]
MALRAFLRHQYRAKTPGGLRPHGLKPGMLFPLALIMTVWSLAGHLGGSLSEESSGTGVLLPDGREFVSWKRPIPFTKTYYVDNRNPLAADANPGTSELPFLTINRAAQVLQPGERVIIMTGVFRERIDPARGGTGADRMISYEAAPGADVVVKGSRLVKTEWRPSTRYKLSVPDEQRAQVKIYERRLDGLDLQGYNPFGMAGIMHNRVYLMPKPEELWRHLKRRGMVFVDGRRLEQVELYQGLGDQDGAFWCEHDGLTIHIRLPGDADPDEHEVELAIQEQVFAPRMPELAFIRVKGITFEHAANGFPVPQRGLVSMSRGHHWIIEDCVIRHANGVALDIGAQDWDMVPPLVIGYAIVRRNHIDGAGVCGIAGVGVQNTLIESNLIEHVGYQDVELAWETGGIKLHLTKNCLLRANVIRHMVHAEAVIAHNLIGLTQDAAIKFRTIESRIVSGRRGTTRRNKVLNNIFFRCGKAIDFSNSDNTADGNLYTKDWGATGDENQAVGRGLNWIPDAGTTLRLDLEAWRKFFGFDKNGAYADMTIDVDLDALTMTWAVLSAIPELPSSKHFQKNLVAQTAGAVRKPGPLVQVPKQAATVSIDPRQ